MIKTQFYLKMIIYILLAILFSIAVLLAVVVYYVAPARTPSTPPKTQPAVKKTVIMDLKTGKPIPEAQVKAMEQKNAEELRVTVVSGKVVAKSPDSLQVEVSIEGEMRIWEIAVVLKTQFFAAVPGAQPSLEKELKKISFAEVKVGDRVTLLSDEGILVNQIGEKKIEVDSLTVQRYDAPDLSND